MDDYSSEDYSDHDDDYYIVSTPTSPKRIQGQVEIQNQSNDLQNLIMGQQVDVSESVYFDVLSELEAQTAEGEGGCMEQSIYLPVESYFDLEVHAETSVAIVLEAEIGSYLEAHVETSLPTALDIETVLEEGDLIESESLETVEAGTIVTTIESMIKELVFEAVEESESDLEVEDAIKEPKSDVDHVANVGPKVETAIEEGDVIGGSVSEGVEFDNDLDTVEQGDVINESLSEGVKSDYDLDAVEERDVIGESIYEAVESDCDLDVEAEDMVEEAEVVVEEAVHVVEEEDLAKGEDDMGKEEDDFVEEEDVMVEEEHDVIDDALESGNSLEVEVVVKEGAAIEESIYEPLDLQVEEPKALAEPAVSIEMTTFEAKEPYFDFEPEEPEDLSDEQSDSWNDEFDLSKEEWDSDVEEYSDIDLEDDFDMDSFDSDQTKEEEDDVVVSYLNSPTPIRNKAWKSLVLAWTKLPVTDIPTLGDSSLLESFLDRGPLLVLQECGNVVMNVIETLLCELLRIRNDLRRVFGALFRQRETTKHA